MPTKVEHPQKYHFRDKKNNFQFPKTFLIIVIIINKYSMQLNFSKNLSIFTPFGKYCTSFRKNVENISKFANIIDKNYLLINECLIIKVQKNIKLK